MAMLDDETVEELLKAAFAAGRKMEQDMADKVFAMSAKVGAKMLAKANGDETKLAAALGGISALRQAQEAMAKFGEAATVFTKVVRMSEFAELATDGCGVCDACMKAKANNAPRSN